MASCDYSVVPCPKQCKDASNKVQCFKRIDLERHLNSFCPYRPAQCQLCFKEGTHVEIQAHDETCPQKKVPCPNCKELVLRQNMDNHIKNACYSTKHPCTIRCCTCTVTRREEYTHKKDVRDSLHLHAALDHLVQLDGDIFRLKAKLQDSSLTFLVPQYQSVYISHIIIQ